MNKTTEALKLAKKALQLGGLINKNQALTAIREALAEPVKQEPVEIDIEKLATEHLVVESERLNKNGIRVIEIRESDFITFSALVAVTAYSKGHNEGGKDFDSTVCSMFDTQEPVAVVDDRLENRCNWFVKYLEKIPDGTKLYASTVRTKDLTDDEIWNDVYDASKHWSGFDDFNVIEFARAVIAADRKLNGGDK